MGGAANWTLNQHAHAQGKNIDLIPAVMIGGLVSSLVMLPLAWPFQASAHDIGLLFALGLFQLAIPCSLAILCATVLKAPEMALLGLLEVIFGIVLAWLGAGEVPGHEVFIGATLVMGALMVNELVAWKSRV
jgi:drug/metabolite transporter (DMT)-like permease